MKGEKKENDAIDWTMGVLRTDYVRAYKLVDEQQARINAMPKGKERNFLQRDLDTWKGDFKGQLDFKQGLMERMGIESNAKTFMYSEEQLADIYERIKDMPFDLGSEEDMPSASG